MFLVKREAAVDGQSVETATMISTDVGYDAGKKVHGRKRQLKCRYVRALFCAQIILRCVRWYCSYPLSYRQVAEMVNERGIDVNHTTVCALGTRVWKRNRQALPQRAIAVAVDCGRPGQQRSRDATAAIRFFRKALNAVHTQEPRVINEG